MSEVHQWEQWIHKSLVLNQNNLPHWGAKHKIVNDLKLLGKAAALKLGKKFQRVRLDVTVSYPTRASADAANYGVTLKHYVDGMVDKPKTVKGLKQGPARGFIPDDSDAHFSGPYLTGTGETSGRKDFFLFRFTLTVIE